MIREWGKPFIRLKNFPTMTGFGESNGLVVFATTRLFQAIL